MSITSLKKMKERGIARSKETEYLEQKRKYERDKQRRFREMSRYIIEWYERVTGCNRKMVKLLLEREELEEIEYKFKIKFIGRQNDLIYEMWRNENEKI